MGPIILSALTSPPDSLPALPPTVTTLDSLRFGDLTWENFEKLCHRLASRGNFVEAAYRYGGPGQSQQGVDIVVRQTDDSYTVWQAKRYEVLKPNDIKKAVKKFLEGTWRARANTLVLATQSTLTNTALQEEIETQTTALKNAGIYFHVFGESELSEKLRAHPDLVFRFFGSAWVHAFLGHEISDSFKQSVSTPDLAKVRHQLLNIYQSQAHVLDAQILDSLDSLTDRSAPLDIISRYAEPDVVVVARGIVRQHEQLDSNVMTSSSDPKMEGDRIRHSVRRRDNFHRIRLSDWLSNGTSFAIFGDAGTGKSTLLRCIAVDLLGDQRIFKGMANEWGDRIPLLIPFSRWARASKDAGGAVGIKEIARTTLQQLLHADLLIHIDRIVEEEKIVLLIDGLDEWMDEQAARATFNSILTISMAHRIPVVATARPRGLEKIGSIPTTWKNTQLAPLTSEQQSTLIERTLLRYYRNSDGTEDTHAASVKTKQMVAQIHADASIGPLASIPLLLLGLIVLILKKLSLPRNRHQAIGQLSEILLETHPQRRATEAGETVLRFKYATDASMRREIVARLAFAIRSEGADSGYSINSALSIAKDFLISTDTYGLSQDVARNIAQELLSVNAETMGIIVEKSPGYIGFAHAVFEEFLSASHIASWTSGQSLEFVASHCGEARWRNVIINFCLSRERRSEFQELLAAISAADTDAYGSIIKRTLLAELAFSFAKKPAGATDKLISECLDQIEIGSFSSERKLATGFAIHGYGDVSIPPHVRLAVERWSPRRLSSFHRVFDAMQRWPKSDALAKVLIKGLFDEDRSDQVSAANALVAVFRGDIEIGQQLHSLLRSTQNLAACAAVLMALQDGWPEIDTTAYNDSAAQSQYTTLQFVGIRGQLYRHGASKDILNGLLGLLRDFSPLSYVDKNSAAALLISHWPNNQEIMERCLRPLQERHDISSSDIERAVAIRYILTADVTNEKVLLWLEQELKSDFPFSLNDSAWDHIYPFTAANPKLRALVVSRIMSEKSEHFIHKFLGFISKDKGTDILNHFVKLGRGTSHYKTRWSLITLTRVWGSDHPEVAKFIEEIRSWDLSDFADILSQLPSIFPDSTECRKILLDFARKNPGHQNDGLCLGLAGAGCDGSDDEAVQMILAGISDDHSYWNGSDHLFSRFSENGRVREYLLKRLQMREPPLEAAAVGFHWDEGVREQVLSLCQSLPAFLREVIAGAAEVSGDSDPYLADVMAKYDYEVDTDLKVQLSIAHHIRAHDSGSIDTVQLIKDCDAVGMDNSERRAAAFAGLLVTNNVSIFAKLNERSGEPKKFSLGSSYLHESPALLTQIAKRWSEMKSEFGDSLFSRFGVYGGRPDNTWDTLAPYLQFSEEISADFVAYCATPAAKLGPAGFRALHLLRPGTELLRRHCHEALTSYDDRGSSPYSAMQARIEAALILRGENDGQLLDYLVKATDQRRIGRELLLLLLYSPQAEIPASIDLSPMDAGRKYGRWCLATALALARKNTSEIVEVFSSMVNRRYFDIWDFQPTINALFIEYLQHSSEFSSAIRGKFYGSAGERASIPRFIVSAGKADFDFVSDCRKLLDHELSAQLIVRGGFDAISDAVRPVSASLLDALNNSTT